MSNQVMRTGGGTFDPHEKNVHFLASNTERFEHAYPVIKHLLMAVNEIEGPDSEAFFTRAVSDPSKKVFLDSGVFNLAMVYARNNKVSMDVALSMAPTEIEGFDRLLERYVSLVQTHGDNLWGYIEVDQGGRENKIKTRARLESMGLRPIPVYHPLNDGWDYFDYLAERYDRICFGNIVKASAPMRQRLIATAWERHRKYPHLWIHLLGLTPNQNLNALPINSCDSSTWLGPIRWPSFPCLCDGKVVCQMGQGYRYAQGTKADADNGAQKNIRLAAYMSYFGMLGWRQHISELVDEGFTIYPEPDSREKIGRANGH